MFALALTTLGFGGAALWLWTHPRTVLVPGPPYPVHVPPVPLPPVPQPDPMPRPDLAPVPVPAPAPVAPLVDDKALPDGGEHHGEVQALPDEPDTIPDSVVDGARFGRLVARAGATRGAVPRRDRRLRRQHAALAVINRCDPPLLLSAVAAGRPGSAVPQLSSVQVLRSIRTRINERAPDLDGAWTALVSGNGDKRALGEVLTAVVAALTDPLSELGRRRNQAPDALAVELTCVLSRLGDTDRRQHLAFGVGGGPVLRLSPDQSWAPILDPTGSTPSLPHHSPDVSWDAFETKPGDVVALCTASTAGLTRNPETGGFLAEQWIDPAPLPRYLWQLNIHSQTSRDDRAAVCLWDLADNGH
ncbi:hypothetical protein ACFQ1L_46405 [Phytohabitans flavus]|uniref:hypothetical protein n=1 Tax=Phytohabitans flavus TaxID=1076124 RepID=UPI003634E30F